MRTSRHPLTANACQRYALGTGAGSRIYGQDNETGKPGLTSGAGCYVSAVSGQTKDAAGSGIVWVMLTGRQIETLPGATRGATLPPVLALASLRVNAPLSATKTVTIKARGARVNATCDTCRVDSLRATSGTLAAGGSNLVCAKPNQKPNYAGSSRLEGRHGKSHTPSSACFRAEALSGVAGTKKHNIAVSGGRELGRVTRLRSAKTPTTTPRNSGQLSTNCVTGHWRISARAAFLKLRINPKCRGSIQRKGPRGSPNRPLEKRTEQTQWWPQAKGNVPSRPRHGRTIYDRRTKSSIHNCANSGYERRVASNGSRELRARAQRPSTGQRARTIRCVCGQVGCSSWLQCANSVLPSMIYEREAFKMRPVTPLAFWRRKRPGRCRQVCSETVAAKRAVNQWMNPAALTLLPPRPAMRTRITAHPDAGLLMVALWVGPRRGKLLP